MDDFLLEQAHWIADKEHLEEERKHLQQVFLQNRNSRTEIQRTFARFDSKWGKNDKEGRRANSEDWGGGGLCDSHDFLSNCNYLNFSLKSLGCTNV